MHPTFEWTIRPTGTREDPTFEWTMRPTGAREKRIRRKFTPTNL